GLRRFLHFLLLELNQNRAMLSSDFQERIKEIIQSEGLSTGLEIRSGSSPVS
ncbi:unnamed protein product, partial [Bubo scandiacus]